MSLSPANPSHPEITEAPRRTTDEPRMPLVDRWPP